MSRLLTAAGRCLAAAAALLLGDGNARRVPGASAGAAWLSAGLPVPHAAVPAVPRLALLLGALLGAVAAVVLCGVGGWR